MVITHKVKMDLVKRGELPQVEVMQGDCFSRAIELELTVNGTAWQIPEPDVVCINYKLADGESGIYDTMEDSSPAWSVEGNRITVLLSAAICSGVGPAELSVTLQQGEKLVSSFPMVVQVLGNPMME